MGMMELRRRVLDSQPYIFLDHVVGTGYKSRIDTGIMGNNNSLSFDFCLTWHEYNAWQGCFGNYVNEDTNAWRLVISSTNGRLIYNSNGKAGASWALVPGIDSLEGKKIKAHIGFLTATVTIDDKTVTDTRTNRTMGTVNTDNIAIGSPNVTNDSNSTRKITWYYFRAYDNGVLIRDYRPCMRRSDGKYGFFEMISKTFCPSIGTVDFTAD